jgi:hypothetical protein
MLGLLRRFSYESFGFRTEFEQFHEVLDRAIWLAEVSREFLHCGDALLAHQRLVLFGQFEAGWWRCVFQKS